MSGFARTIQASQPVPPAGKNAPDSSHIGSKNTLMIAWYAWLEFMRHAREAFRNRHRSELKRHIRHTGGKMIRNRRGTGATGTLVAYEEMNRLVSNALGGLDRRERTAWKNRVKDGVGSVESCGRQEGKT